MSFILGLTLVLGFKSYMRGLYNYTLYKGGLVVVLGKITNRSEVPKSVKSLKTKTFKISNI